VKTSRFTPGFDYALAMTIVSVRLVKSSRRTLGLAEGVPLMIAAVVAFAFWFQNTERSFD
jgi:hypothetical protein